MNCRRCGAALAPGALGCPVCGEPAEDCAGAGARFDETGAGDAAAAGIAETRAAARLRADLIPTLDAADVADDVDEADAPDDVDDPFAPADLPAFSADAAFCAQERQPFEPLPYMDAPQPAYAEPAPVEARTGMRTGSKVLVGLVVLVLLAALAGVGYVWVQNSRLVAESNVRYTVSYETNGGSLVESQEVKTGTLIMAPREPTISGRYFAGWYTDTTYQTQITFPLEVDHDMTLYARWTRDKDKADAALAKQDSTQSAAEKG